MTYIINHRINSLSKLERSPKRFGIEIDVRDYKNKIVLNHEPMTNGLSFEIFLENFKHKFLIINVKSEGLERIIISMLKEKKIDNYFFLDSTVPTSLKLNKNINKSLRISDIENINFKSKKINNFNWVWIDYINNIYSIKKSHLIYLRKLKIKNCFVSPELIDNKISPKKLETFLSKNKIIPDAICTKKPLFWEKIFKSS